MSQYSEGGFSDIISDVDTFIKEQDMNSMIEQVQVILDTGRPSQSLNEQDLKLYAMEFPAQIPSIQHIPPMIGFPPAEPKELCNEDYAGPFNFEVYIVPNDFKTPWEFSPKLNKIFIGMGLKFPVAFSIRDRPDHTNFYVRATPVFSQAHHFKELVFRCLGHEANKQDPSNKDMPEHVFQHIMRCSNEDARYFGDKTGGRRLNIVMPLGIPQAGTDVVKEYFHFVCKNSCPSGMNRRPIEVIFTLENSSGKVLGRRVVCVRICSCPKRDREKEEKDLEKSNEPNPAQGKKRKMGTNDMTKDSKKPMVTVPTPTTSNSDLTHYQIRLNVPTLKCAKEILKFGESLMAAEILERQGSRTEAPFRKCYTDIKEFLGTLPKE